MSPPHRALSLAHTTDLRKRAQVSETTLAVLLGVAVVDYGMRAVKSQQTTATVWDWPFLSYGMLVLLAARAANIVTISFFANCFRRPAHRITARMQLVMWFAGMRGAVSFALAITLPASTATASPAGSSAVIADWTIPVVTTTLGVVLITNLLMAPLTGPLIRSLNLVADDVRRASRSSTHNGVGPPIDSGPLGQLRESLRDSGSVNAPCGAEAANGEGCASHVAAPPSAPPIARAWRLIDDHYLKPYLGGRVHRRGRTFDPQMATHTMDGTHNGAASMDDVESLSEDNVDNDED